MRRRDPPAQPEHRQTPPCRAGGRFRRKPVASAHKLLGSFRLTRGIAPSAGTGWPAHAAHGHPLLPPPVATTPAPRAPSRAPSSRPYHPLRLVHGRVSSSAATVHPHGNFQKGSSDWPEPGETWNTNSPVPPPSRTTHAPRRPRSSHSAGAEVPPRNIAPLRHPLLPQQGISQAPPLSFADYKVRALCSFRAQLPIELARKPHP